MPKRKNTDKSEDYILRKIRKIKKIERKLKKHSRSYARACSTSSDNSDTELSAQKDNQTEVPVDLINVDDNLNNEINEIELSPHESYHQESAMQIEPGQQNLDQISELPSTSAAPLEPAIILDENILELLGETPSKKDNYSSPIQDELAIRWEHIATTGLSKDMKKELLGKYFLPENCLRIGAPKLNAEIKAALSDTLLKKDTTIETKQNQQAVAISCISQALTKIFASPNKDADIIKLLIDATRLLCDSQYVESMSRRCFVTSTIKKEIKDQLYATEIDKYLFGEKLADTLKSAKAINKSGAEIKTAPQHKPAILSQPRFNQSLNFRPPFPLVRQTETGRRSTPAMQQPRRYQAPPPPPLPSRQPAMRYHPRLPAPQQRSRGRMHPRR